MGTYSDLFNIDKPTKAEQEPTQDQPPVQSEQPARSPKRLQAAISPNPGNSRSSASDTQVPKHPRTQVPEHLDTKTPKHPGIQVPKHPGTQVPEHPDVRFDLFEKTVQRQSLDLTAGEFRHLGRLTDRLAEEFDVVKVDKQDIIRVALHLIFEDYERQGTASELVRRLRKKYR